MSSTTSGSCAARRSPGEPPSWTGVRAHPPGPDPASIRQGCPRVRIMHLLKHGVQGNGHVHVAVDLACRQAAAGHQVSFVSSGGSYDRLLTDHGVQVATIPESGGLRGTARSGLGLLRLARASRPDVMHAHMMSSAVLGFGVAKLVGATAGHHDAQLLRAALGPDAAGQGRRGGQRGRTPAAACRGGTRPRKVVTVVNGADGSPREELPGDGIGPLARPAVMTLSGLHPRKAVGDVIAAFAEVHPQFPDWHLNIVGWGPDRERLESLAAELRHRSDRFTSSARPPAPRPLLVSSRTSSRPPPWPIPARWPSPRPGPPGCAVVATSVGGVPEVLDHGQRRAPGPAVSNPAAMADGVPQPDGGSRRCWPTGDSAPSRARSTSRWPG